MDKLKVLVADDEDIIREGICQFVPWEALGYELVGSAWDGQMVLDMLETQPVDVLITDIQMPKATGLDIIETIVQKNLDVAVVLVTGYDEFDYAKRAIHSKRVYDYLVKPVNPAEFTELLTHMREDIMEWRRRVDVPVLAPEELERLHNDDNEAHERITRSIIAHVSKGEKREALDGFEALWHSFEERDYSDALVRRGCLELALKLRWTLIQRGLSARTWYEGAGDPLCDIATRKTRDEVRDYCTGLIALFCDSISPQGFSSISPLVKVCADVIKSEYCNPSFSLQYLAERMKVSANYLSSCFKKEMGVGFLKYVNGLRIIKAQELLGDVRLRTYEIANMVGIEDQRYFSRLFKEQTGMSPSEYRALL